MTPSDSRLLRHLSIAIAVKLVVLVLLWWFFVRDQRVIVNAEQAAAQIGMPSSKQGKSK
jgi:hypothetical protein